MKEIVPSLLVFILFLNAMVAAFFSDNPNDFSIMFSAAVIASILDMKLK